MAELIMLDELKEQLDKTSTDDDAELMDVIEATTPVVEDITGPVIPKTFIERHPGGPRLTLFRTPVISITSVVPWLTIGTIYDVLTLTIDSEFGHVYRLNGLPFTGGPFKVTYVAGRQPVPANIRLGAKMIAAHLWDTQRGKLVKLPTGGGTSEARVPPGYAAPKHAQELLQASVKGPVVA
jgi:hypothetical protein